MRISKLKHVKKPPRPAYCTGCETTFPKMHQMINHRRTFRCGGRFEEHYQATGEDLGLPIPLHLIQHPYLQK